MKILLRNKESGLFWERPNRWTLSTDQAFDFRFVDRAQHYVDRGGLVDVEIALVWDSPLPVESIPMEQSVTEFAA